MQHRHSLFLLLTALLAVSVTTHSDLQGLSRSALAGRLSTTPAAERPQRLAPGYGKLPLSFEPFTDKRGADGRPLRFLARGRGGYVFELSGHEAVVVLSGGGETTGVGPTQSDDLTESAAAPNARTQHSPLGAVPRLTLQFMGGRTDATGRGEAPLPGKVHYLSGNEPSAWRTNIPTYSAVRYEGVYPGIDLVYYGNQGDLEYDFVVAPGADPTAIALSFEGADAVKVDEAGDLELLTAAGVVRQRKPFIYQEVDGQRRVVDGRYKIADTQVRIEVDAYDTSSPLIIDPVVVYSGGAGSGSGATGVAVDAAGNAYIGGNTHPGSVHGGRDGFVRKINAAGSAVLWTTFIGGSNDDSVYGIAIDEAGAVYITGRTRSVDFPTKAAFDHTYNGGSDQGSGDGFVAKLTPDGASFVYSTYLGGSNDDAGHGIAVRGGHAYVVGHTFRGTGAEFPTTPGAFQAVRPGLHAAAFVTRFDAAGALVSSTFLGSSGGHPTYGRGIAIDASGNTYVTGAAAGGNFPTVNPAQTWSAPMWRSDNAEWAFISKLNPAGTALVYSTYFGGGEPAFENKGAIGTRGLSIAVDATGSAYVTGETHDVNLPVTAGAFQQSCPFQDGVSWIACRDAFVTKLSPNGGTFLYATYLGALESDYGNGITVDAAGRAHVTGGTSSLNFPVVDAFQPTKGMSGSGTNAFFTVVNPAGTELEYSTYLGGSDGETGYAVALDTSRNAYVVGGSVSSDFPRVGGLSTAGGGHVSLAGAFITKFSAVGCGYAVEPTASISVPAAGTSGPIDVATMPGCDWAAWTTVPWLTLTPASASGSGAAMYTVAPNSSVNPRTGTLNIAGTTIVVQQAGFVQQTCTYTLAPSVVSAPAAGSAGTINVTTTAGCGWTASSTVPWVTVSGASPGSGAATFTVIQNLTTSSRAGSLLIAGHTVQVLQAAGTSLPPPPPPPAGPPGAPMNLGATVSGNTVNLAWTAPTTGAAPTDYALLGRLSAGAPVVATVPMGSGTAFSVTAPNGTFVLTVRASNGNGTGPESTSVTVTVPQLGPPPVPPSDLVANVTGTTVSFSWTPPSSGAVTNYVLVAGLTPGFSVPYATMALGPSPGVAVPGVPPGIYYVRVLAQNASATSAASNEVMVTVAGAAAPAAPTLRPPVVTGTTVALSWSAGAGDAPTHYTLTASVTPGGAPIATVPLIGTAASFADVPPGTYYLQLTASNVAGTSPPAHVMLNVP